MRNKLLMMLVTVICINAVTALNFPADCECRILRGQFYNITCLPCASEEKGIEVGKNLDEVMLDVLGIDVRRTQELKGERETLKEAILELYDPDPAVFYLVMTNTDPAVLRVIGVFVDSAGLWHMWMYT